MSAQDRAAIINKQQVEWHHVEIGFKSDIDVQALLEAIAVPDDVGYDADMDDGLKRRFIEWGWGTAPIDPDEVGRIAQIGVYGDFTWLEDDERLMPAIAPFVTQWSKAVFTLGRWGDDYQMWEFDGENVVRRPCEKYVEWV